MGLQLLQRIAFLFPILVGNAGLNDFSKPGSKASATFVRHKVAYVVSDGDHRFLDDILRFFMGQTRSARRGINKILVELVEATPTVLVTATNLGQEGRARL